MANRKIMLPQYGTVMKRGVLYYRTRIKDANGKLVALYAKTPEELYNKETLALEQIENATFHRKTPTVAEYCEKWLLMQSVHVRATTLTDYTSKVRRHIIAELGDKRMGEVSLDDIQLALVPVSKKSTSVYKSVVILYKSIFRAAMESRIIDHNPTIYLTTKGGGVPQEDRQALTDEQVERLLDAIRDLPPYCKLIKQVILITNKNLFISPLFCFYSDFLTHITFIVTKAHYNSSFVIMLIVLIICSSSYTIELQ